MCSLYVRFMAANASARGQRAAIFASPLSELSGFCLVVDCDARVAAVANGPSPCLIWQASTALAGRWVMCCEGCGAPAAAAGEQAQRGW